MANNRVYVYCAPCNAAKMLAKHLADGWYLGPHSAALEGWWDEHKACAGVDDGVGGTLLDLRYESVRGRPELELPKDAKVWEP